MSFILVRSRVDPTGPSLRVPTLPGAVATGSSVKRRARLPSGQLDVSTSVGVNSAQRSIDENVMLTGTCLCGEVTIEIDSEVEHAPEACHCAQCRKHSGHFLATINIRREALTVRGDSVVWYQSSDKVRRGFCSICGSTLFWDPTIEGYQYTAVAMGLFDESTDLRLAKHEFVSDKGDYYEITDGVPQREEF